MARMIFRHRFYRSVLRKARVFFFSPTGLIRYREVTVSGAATRAVSFKLPVVREVTLSGPVVRELLFNLRV